MVLRSGRVAVFVTLALLVAGVFPCDAQRAGRVGLAQPGGPRPMLFGFALECSGCTRGKPEGETMLPVWHYTEYPRVVAVAPGGPAERAGVREGDVLMSVDGMSVLSSEGARRFSSARVADEIRLTFDRNGKSIDVALTPRIGRGAFGGGMRGERPMREPVPREYSGRVGDATIEVTSDDPVVATTDASGVLTLRIGGTIVRVRPTQTPPERPKSSKSGSSPSSS